MSETGSASKAKTSLHSRTRKGFVLTSSPFPKPLDATKPASPHLSIRGFRAMPGRIASAPSAVGIWAGTLLASKNLPGS